MKGAHELRKRGRLLAAIFPLVVVLGCGTADVSGDSSPTDPVVTRTPNPLQASECKELSVHRLQSLVGLDEGDAVVEYARQARFGESKYLIVMARSKDGETAAWAIDTTDQGSYPLNDYATELTGSKDPGAPVYDLIDSPSIQTVLGCADGP